MLITGTKFGQNIFGDIKILDIFVDINLIPSKFFFGCSTLTQIVFPSSVASIGYLAFSGCSSLVQAAIPSSAISNGDLALGRCY